MLFDASEIEKLFTAKHAMLIIKMIQGFQDELSLKSETKVEMEGMWHE